MQIIAPATAPRPAGAPIDRPHLRKALPLHLADADRAALRALLRERRAAGLSQEQMDLRGALAYINDAEWNLLAHNREFAALFPGERLASRSPAPQASLPS